MKIKEIKMEEKRPIIPRLKLNLSLLREQTSVDENINFIPRKPSMPAIDHSKNQMAEQSNEQTDSLSQTCKVFDSNSVRMVSVNQQCMFIRSS